MPSTKYTSYHHWFFLKIFRFFLVPFTRIYYGFERKKIKIRQTGPYLILSNHTAEFDVFLNLMFDAPLYFVASDQLLNAGKGSWVLRTFFNPIPKSKSVADLALVKRIKSVIQEGGNVAIFPEGNASMHGGPSRIPSGMGRLIKFLKVPVKLIRVEGLYLSTPRWSYYRKFGRTRMDEITTLTLPWIESHTAEVIEEMVTKTLAISAYEKPLGTYQGRRRAEGLHKLIFTCPQCSELFTTYSQGHELKCHRCSFKGFYDVNGYLNIGQNRYNLIDLDRENQQRFHQRMLREWEQFSFETSVAVATWEGGRAKRTPFTQMTLRLDQNGVLLKSQTSTMQYPFSQIFSEAIQVRRKLLLYPIDAPTIIVRFRRDISPYAMLMIIQWYKAMILKGNHHEPYLRSDRNSHTLPVLGI
jgi:1-acyl-sn-glycerol-3-phosphate acyltransferase/DNA-directed RNA polymerase subunit RPC12/RpoP